MDISPFLGYLIGIASGATPAVAYKTYDYLTYKYPLRKLWKGFISEQTFGILSCSGELIDIDTLSTGLYDTMALADIKTLLSSFRKTVFLPYNVKNFPPNIDKNNLVLFGGPLSNKLTERIMIKKKKTSLQFKNHSIINNENNTPFKPEITNDRVTKDFGIIVKMKNIFNPKFDLIILAGCYDYGTYLSAAAVSNPDIVKTILGKVGTQDFEMVVSGDVIEGVPQTPTIEEDGIVVRSGVN